MVGKFYCGRLLIQIKHVKLPCCFSAKHAVLRRKSKDGLAEKQENASQWNYALGLLSWSTDRASTIKIQSRALV